MKVPLRRECAELRNEENPTGHPFQRRALHLIGIAALLCVVCTGGWILVTGLMARSELFATQRSLDELRASVPRTAPALSATGRRDAANPAAAMRAAADHAASAHRLTTGPAWFLAAEIPILGEPVATVRGVARAVDRLTHEVLPPLVELAAGGGESHQGGLRHALTRLNNATPDLSRASLASQEVQNDVHRLTPNTWMSTVNQAHSRLTRDLDRLTTLLSRVDVAARVMPSMLGADGPRRYLVVFQNTAESRGTGGLPGAYAVLTVEEGHPRFESFGTDMMLAKAEPAIDLGPEYTTQYDGIDPTGTWVNSNVSPHFPYAARIWSAVWHEYSGQRVDGAIALDPSGLARLLQATGPARMHDGTELTAENIVDLVERTTYARYPDVTQRKTFLLDVARTASSELVNGLNDPRRLPGLLRGTYDVMNQERLKVWSARQNEQLHLANLPLSGVLPTTHGPFAGLVVNNAAGNKLDYYLHRELHWTPGRCTRDGRQVTAEISLTNRAPRSGLPPYVTIRSDQPDYPTSPGDNRLLVSYYASAGARLIAASVDGRRVMVHSGVERGHPVYTVDLELPAQVRRTLTLQLLEPMSDQSGPPELLHQPLVRPMQSTSKDYGVCPSTSRP